MDANPLLALAPGLYRGRVTGLESGECSARIEVRRVPGGAVTVDYEATSERHGLQHREHTLGAPDALYVAFSEATGVTVFTRTGGGVFVATAPGPYALEIHAAVDGDTLDWAWHWAEAGAMPREMSRAVCRLTEA